MINLDLFSKDKNIDNAITVKEVYDIVSKTKELDNHLSLRSILIWPIVAIISIIPFWLVILITLSGFGFTKFSERIQLAFIGAISADFLGICYVVATDLFPKGRDKQRPEGEKEEEEA